MRNQITILIWILSAVLLYGTDTDIHVFTTTKTNESGSITIKEIFTRGGKTNLVRNTAIISGKVRIQIHRFYYDGSLVGEFTSEPNSSGFVTEAGSPYSLSFDFGPTHEVKSAIIGTKDGIVGDAFMATNNVFYPTDISIIRNANDVGSEVEKLFSPEFVTNTSPEKFRHEVQNFIEKHKNETNNLVSPKN
jgi:hypothetical protein